MDENGVNLSCHRPCPRVVVGGKEENKTGGERGVRGIIISVRVVKGEDIYRLGRARHKGGMLCI